MSWLSRIISHLPSPPMGSRTFKTGAVIAAVGAGAVLAAAVSLAMVQHKLIYLPRRYDSMYSEMINACNSRGMKKLTFETSQGKQNCYYFPSLAELEGRAQSDPPKRVWLVFGGNAALALDWFPLVADYQSIHTQQAKQTGFLLVDYPGYGASTGSPSPSSILESTEGAFQSLLSLYKVGPSAPRPFRIGVLGHSLGSAAALAFAASRPTTDPVDKVVLISPFTSIADMARALIGRIPFLDQLLVHKFDNRIQLTQFIKQVHASSTTPTGTSLTIIHGSRDEIVPVRMGRALAEQAHKEIESSGKQDAIDFSYVEIAGGDHNGILGTAEQEVFQALQ